MILLPRKVRVLLARRTRNVWLQTGLLILFALPPFDRVARGIASSNHSSSESDGGILPTVDSSSSESSGYAVLLTNSFGLQEKRLGIVKLGRSS
jgi:hypothetical protein